MAKDKKSSKVAVAAPNPVETKHMKKVKESKVSKPAEKPKAVARESAKEAGKKVKKQSKKLKEPTPPPEPSSESDSESSASSASSDDASDSEVESKLAPKANGAAKNGAASSDSSSDASSDEDREVKAPKNAKAPKTNGAAKAAPAPVDDSDSSESDAEVETKAGAAKQDGDVDMDDGTSSGTSASSGDEDDAPNGGAQVGDASSDSESDSESEVEEKKPVVKEQTKKRKAEEVTEQTPKKTKVVNGEEKEVTGNLFVGNLSWNVDEEWLTREFEEFGELTGVRIITDRDSGRSKGFGYVEFVSPDHAAAALESKQGLELDGRGIRIDFSIPRQPRTEGSTPQQRSSDRAQRYGDTPKEPSATLFVGNVSFDADQSMLNEYFEGYGTVNGVRIPTDRETGEMKGFAYVEMGSIDEAKAAFEALNGSELNGRALRLDYSTPRPDNGGAPRGGGRGGGRGRGGFGDRGGRGGRGGFDRGRSRGGSRGDRGGFTKNRGGFGDFSGKKTSF